MAVKTSTPVANVLSDSRWSFSWSSLFSWLFSISILIALLFGWRSRNEYWITAEDGLGYALGITGGIMMLLLLIYPLRKRLQQTPFFVLSTKNWFKLHMILGVIGPTLILYHSNFGLGSTNSNVALFSMLLMVASGLVGRFIYGKIHYGLYGKKIELNDLLVNKLKIEQALDGNKNSVLNTPLKDKLKMYELAALKHRGLLGYLLNLISLHVTTRFNSKRLLSTLKVTLKNNKDFMALPKEQKYRYYHSTKQNIESYLLTTRKIASLNLFERLFSLWHMLHLPIFFMLIITGFVHVYAVHMY